MLNRLRAASAALIVAAASLAGITGATSAAADTACPTATVSASTPAQLAAALADAQPGDIIEIADGTYDGNWTATQPGTAEAPIWLCGGEGAVLTNDGWRGNYGLHLAGASYWHLYGFSVAQATKGVVVDSAEHVTVEGLNVHDLGDEGIHLRTNTVDSTVVGNRVYDTGHRRDKFGEGIYIGSAQANWGILTGGQPDHSDRNTVTGNTITGTTAEPIDIKEGTVDGAVTGNSLDGGALTEDGGDSCLDAKGNDWTISGNTCTGSLTDGYQTHHNKLIKSGLGDWGLRNTFAGNTATLAANGGYGFKIHDASTTANVVRCDNVVTGGLFANVTCTP